MTPITPVSILESHLREAANILCGDPVDRTDWKSYILPLMFLKRICDVWDEEYEEAGKAYGEDFANGKRKALSGMTTGIGKTRTTMGLIDVFIQAFMGGRLDGCS